MLNVMSENKIGMKQLILSIFLLLVFNVLSGQAGFTDKRDGNIYRTISVEGVIWMAENLRYKAGDGAFFFDNDSNNSSGYGILYSWETAIKACPAGWHLPSGKEFQVLINYLEQKENWGKIPSDPSSFGIQLGGMQDYEGIFSEMDESAYYWTSTEYDKNNSEYFSYLLIDEKPVIDISRKEDIEDIHGTEKINKYSVRCLKD
jgi:uncharacterized protein (TIGR02145 family)